MTTLVTKGPAIAEARFPLSGHITERAKTGYEILYAEVPNDRFILISDALVPNSLTILSTGMEHFINHDPEIDLKAVALAQTLIKYIVIRSSRISASKNMKDESIHRFKEISSGFSDSILGNLATNLFP